HDPAAGRGCVADRVEPNGGIDDPASLDDQLIGLREHTRNTGEHDSACGGYGDKLTPVHHGLAPPDCVVWYGENHCCPRTRRSGTASIVTRSLGNRKPLFTRANLAPPGVPLPILLRGYTYCMILRNFCGGRHLRVR